MKILIATNSFGKLQEISGILKVLPITCVSPKDLGFSATPAEDGKTLRDNALIKAMYYGDKSGLITLSDDSSLEIDALGGEPGIFVRRWPGHEATDEELLSYCLAKMKDVPLEKRGAQFHSVVCVYNPATKEDFYFDGIIRGIIAEQPFAHYIEHYPFDALFYFPELKKYLAEIRDDKQLETQYSHRTKATIAALPKIKELFNLPPNS